MATGKKTKKKKKKKKKKKQEGKTTILFSIKNLRSYTSLVRSGTNKNLTRSNCVLNTQMCNVTTRIAQLESQKRKKNKINLT